MDPNLQFSSESEENKQLYSVLKIYEQQSTLQDNRIKQLVHQIDHLKNKSNLLKKTIKTLDSENNRLIEMMDYYQQQTFNLQTTVEALADIRKREGIQQTFQEIQQLLNKDNSFKNNQFKNYIQMIERHFNNVIIDNSNLFIQQQQLFKQNKINYQRINEFEKDKKLFKQNRLSKVEDLINEIQTLKIDNELLRRQSEEYQSLYQFQVEENNKLLTYCDSLKIQNQKQYKRIESITQDKLKDSNQQENLNTENYKIKCINKILNEEIDSILKEKEQSDIALRKSQQKLIEIQQNNVLSDRSSNQNQIICNKENTPSARSFSNRNIQNKQTSKLKQSLSKSFKQNKSNSKDKKLIKQNNHRDEVFQFIKQSKQRLQDKSFKQVQQINR